MSHIIALATRMDIIINVKHGNEKQALLFPSLSV